MTIAPQRLGRGSVPGGYRYTAERWASKRLPYLDNLKVLLIAGIIAAHAIASYAEEAWWAYSDVREATLSPVTEAVLIAVVAPVGLLMIPLLFLVAGLLTPGSLARKGTGAFVRDRLLRLGVPFAVFALLLWRLLEYALFHPLGEASGSFSEEYFGSDEPLQSGPLWFVGVLLIFSLAYAGWASARGRHTGHFWRGGLDAGHLVVLTVAVAIATFMVRLVVPYDSDEYVALNLYQLPECVALFLVGIAAAHKGWLTAVPEALRRLSRTAVFASLAAFAVFMVVGSILGVAEEEVWGGWHWPAFVFAALESVLAVFGSVWLLDLAQRRLDRRIRWVSPPVSRSAYGAFIAQSVVLIGLAVLLRPFALPAEVKALILVAGGIAGSFALAWLLISRVRVVARIF